MKLLLAIMLMFTLSVSAQDYGFGKNNKAKGHAIDLRADLMNGRVAERTNRSLDLMILVSHRLLKKHGHTERAERLKSEWLNKYFGYVYKIRGLGDHAPLSDWLAEAYKDLVTLLGLEIVEFFHLDDINIMNYALPVVLKCTIAFDIVDYSAHFVPFCGVLAYWGSAGACILLSSGIGTFFCGPIGMLAENIMVNFFAPVISDRVWNAFCLDHKGIYQLSQPNLYWD